MIEHCLRENSQHLACTFFHPKGTTRLMSTWTVPSPELWSEYQRLYLNPRDYPSNPDINRLYERATAFIELTPLMPRAEDREGVLIESDII